MRNYLEIR